VHPIRQDHDFTLRDNPAQSRYEILRDGELLGELQYRPDPDGIVLVHTEVNPVAREKGIGSRLVEFALQDIRSRGLSAVPECSFVHAYVQQHPEHRDS
jgi:uncharacterized protein